MFSITPAALAELQAAAARSDADGMALRIAARERSDGGIEYGMGFDDERENDETLRCEGLTVLLGARSRPHLAATVLDFVELEVGRFDFVFMPQGGGEAAHEGTGAERADHAGGTGRGA